MKYLKTILFLMTAICISCELAGAVSLGPVVTVGEVALVDPSLHLSCNSTISTDPCVTYGLDAEKYCMFQKTRLPTMYELVTTLQPERTSLLFKPWPYEKVDSTSYLGGSATVPPVEERKSFYYDSSMIGVNGNYGCFNELNLFSSSTVWLDNGQRHGQGTLALCQNGSQIGSSYNDNDTGDAAFRCVK